ncbi:MAG: threonine ammonia-lyase [Bacilli bacterium]|nr:threonine ammonia-lyase [Bacilli bacterium]
MKITLKDFQEAQKRIKPIIHRTPLNISNTLSLISEGKIYLKCENLQKTGSFKIRGATNKIAKLAANKKCHTVVTASAGNHAQGVAYAATKFKIKPIVVMPEMTPIAKINATRGYGANIVLSGSCFDEAYETSQAIVKKEKAVYVHPYDDLDVIAGQGTVGLEILEDLKDVDIVVVPAGGGGLLSGVATAIKLTNPKVKVIGVQAENANAIQLSFKKKAKVVTKTSKTIAEGISVKNPGDLTLPLIYRYVDDVITVSEQEIADAIFFLMERNKLVVEGAGATTVAAILNGKINTTHKKVVCVLSGGNIDFTFINTLLEKAMYSHNRRVKLFVLLPSDTRTINSFYQLLMKTNINILNLRVDTSSAFGSIGETQLTILCEIADAKHKQKVIKTLQEHGYQIVTEKESGDFYLYVSPKGRKVYFTNDPIKK